MLPTLFVVLTFSILYWFPIRRWMSRWGATPSDLTRVMAGDALLDETVSGFECRPIAGIYRRNDTRIEGLQPGQFLTLQWRIAQPQRIAVLSPRWPGDG